METIFTQQEILLITGTSFTQRKWSKKDDQQKNNNLSDNDELEEACWNGLLQEMLPEFFGKFVDEKKLYLWKSGRGIFYRY